MNTESANGSFAALSSPAAAAARGAVVLIPVGAVEQHGPHLPLGTDIWLATDVARRAAAQLDDVYVAEPLPVGASAHHRSYPGTLSLRVDTFQRLVVDVATSLADDGFVPVFVNGHGGNRAPLGAALQQLLEAGVSAWAVTYFELIEDAVRETFPPASVGHACALETSLMLSAHPELVDTGAIPAGTGGGTYPDPSLFPADRVVHHRRFEDFGEHGVVGEPSRADRASGGVLADLAVARLAECVERIRSADATAGRGEEGIR